MWKWHCLGLPKKAATTCLVSLADSIGSTRSPKQPGLHSADSEMPIGTAITGRGSALNHKGVLSRFHPPPALPGGSAGVSGTFPASVLSVQPHLALHSRHTSVSLAAGHHHSWAPGRVQQEGWSAEPDQELTVHPGCASSSASWAVVKESKNFRVLFWRTT